MFRIKKYDTWLLESNNPQLSHLLPAEFFQKVQEEFTNAKFVYQIFSTKTQIKNGTLIVEIRMPDFLDTKAKEFNLQDRTVGGYSHMLQMSEKLQIYSRGGVRTPTGSSDFFKFEPTHDGIKNLVENLKRRFFKYFLYRLKLKPDSIKVPKGLKGYPISQKSLDFIIAKIKDKTLSDEFPRIFKNSSPEIRNAFSPLLVMAYLMKEAGIEINFMSTNEEGLYLRIPIPGKSWGDTIRVGAAVKYKLSSDISKLEIKQVVSMDASFYNSRMSDKPINDYLKLADQATDNLRQFIKTAIDPKSADLEDLAYRKRGLVVGSEFGF